MTKHVRLTSLVLAMVVFTSMAMPAYATENPTHKNYDGIITTYQRPEEEVDKELMEMIRMENESTFETYSLTMPKAPPKWKYDYGTPVYTDVSGWAGNQISGGYNLPGGGMLIYSPSGGPEVSVSVSLSDPWGIFTGRVGIGTKVGNSSTITLACTVPADQYYYKIYATKTMKIQPWTSYYFDYTNQEWVEYMSSSTMTEYSHSAYAKRV